MTIEPGMRIGPYEVEALLGRGGMGEVFRALDPRLARRVAIKVLPSDFALDFERLRRFDQEARAIAQISHPNIVQVFDVGLHEGIPFLVMELLEGSTLRALIDRGPLPPRKAAEVASQIASGLSAAHARGIIHRDLKPENVFLGPEGMVKVLDFGLVKVREGVDSLHPDPANPSVGASATGDMVVLGTAGYMAPEQINGERVDGRTDIFALGAVLWEMVTGCRAFQGDSAIDTLHAILRRELPDLAPELVVPASLERIIRRCLEKDPASRFQSSKDLVFALEWVTREPRSSLSSEHPSGIGEAGGRRSRRQRYMIGAAAIVLLSLAVAGGLHQVRAAKPAVSPLRFERITVNPTKVQAARFSPDGQTVVYSGSTSTIQNDLELYRMGPGDSMPVPLGRAGKILAVDAQGELYFTTQKEFTNPGASDASPLFRWKGLETEPKEWFENIQDGDVTHDGQNVAVIRLRLGPNSIRGSVLEFPPGQVILESEQWLASPRISPKGGHIAFIQRPGDGWAGRIVIITREGKQVFESPDLGGVRSIAWSPDENEILFTSTSFETDQGHVGSFLAACDRSGKVREIFRGTEPLMLFDVSRQGSLLAYGYRERTDTWLNRGRGWEHLPGMIEDVPTAMSPDGSLVLTNSLDIKKGFETMVRSLPSGRATRLGPGWHGLAISQDNRFALLARWPPKEVKGDETLLLMPLRAGAPIPVHSRGVGVPILAHFLPGKPQALVASINHSRLNLHIVSPDHPPEPFVIPGMDVASAEELFPLEPGLAIRFRGAWYLSPWATRTPIKLKGLTHSDYPISWDPAGKELIVLRDDEMQLLISIPHIAAMKGRRIPIHRVDLESGRRSHVRDLEPLEGDLFQLLVPSRWNGSVVAVRNQTFGGLVRIDGAVSGR